MAAGPIAIVTALIDFEVDPDNANNVLIRWEFQLLFCGPVPLAEQDQVSVSSSSTKAQIKSAINNAIIASAAAKGFSLATSKIFTVAEIAG